MKTIRKYYIDGCFHCKRIEKTYEELKKKFDGLIDFQSLKVNNKDTEKEYNLSIYPTVCVYDEDCEEINRISGFISPKELEKFVEKESAKGE